MTRPESIQALFDAIRDSARPAIWSLGVQLARRQSVQSDGARGDELCFRISAPGRAATAVFLNPEDEDWECECASTEDVCEHTAAAIIALRRADTEPSQALEEAAPRGHIAYRFVEDGRMLRLERLGVRGDQVSPLTSSLEALVRRGDCDLEIRPSDLRLEQVLGPRLREPLNTGLMLRALKALSDCSHVRLGDLPIEIHGDPILPRIVVEERGDGFVVSVRRDPDVERVFANGVALRKGALRPIGESRLTHREREELTPGKYFGPEQLHSLISEVLPSLEERLPVDRRSERLPLPTRTTPELEVRVERDRDRLRIQASIVYGDPPLARLEGDVLRPLGDQLPVRLPDQEAALARRLRDELGVAPGQTSTLEAEAAIDLRERLEAFRGRLIGGAHRDFFLAAPLEPRLELDPERFDLGFRARTSGREVRVEGSRVIEAFRSGSSLAALPGGGFAPIPTAFLAEHGQRIADLLAAKATASHLPTAALPDLAALCRALDQPLPPDFARLQRLVDDFTELPAAELKAPLAGILREYQKRGVAWLSFLRDAGLGALLADDMGLGKTLQALCAMRGRSLVVCPTSVLYGWTEQIGRFLPDAKLCIYHGPKRALDPSAAFTLTTYALLRLDQEALRSVTWDCLVLDEAQAIKNAASQVARAAFELRAEFRIALTGTPIENRLEELWSQLHFTNPGLLGGLADFRERYARPIGDGESGVARHLRERIRPFVLRRLKSQVALELPPRTEDVLYCELSSDERSVYDAVRAATQQEVAERLSSGGSVLEVLEALLRLRQAACHPALVPGERVASESSTKLDVLLETLDEVVSSGSRALVFSQWTSFLDLVEPRLRTAELAFGRLDGSTRNRDEVVREFQSEQGPPVLLISLRAGGTGLNLTAADHVFLLDPWWNPAVEDQAADRVHRIGQERPVFIHRLVAVDTVEERILALQQRKRAVADVALAEAQRAASITREELLHLLD